MIGTAQYLHTSLSEISGTLHEGQPNGRSKEVSPPLTDAVCFSLSLSLSFIPLSGEKKKEIDERIHLFGKQIMIMIITH